MNSEISALESPHAGDWALYRRLLKYLKGQWLLFVVAVVGFLLGAGAEAFFAQVLGQVVDSFDADSEVHIWYFPTLIVIAALVRAFGSITGELLLSRISFRVVHVLRCELFERLLVVPSEFFEASAQGQIVSRLTFTTAQLRDTATDALKIIFQDGGKLLVLLAFMFWQNWLLTAIFLLVTPLVGGVVRYASKRFRRISERIQSSMGDVTHVASEAVTGYRVMRAFGGEKYEQDRFSSASDRNRRQNLKMVATKASSAQVIQVFVAISIGGLIGLVFQPDIVGAKTRGELITYIGLAGLLASPIKRLSDVNARLQRGLAAASDVFSQIDQDTERNDGTHVDDRVSGKVEFRNVSFRYSANQHDSLSSININYYETGQQLGWHFDNASFAVTLMIQSPRTGGRFEYVQGSRDSEKGDPGYETVQKVLEGTTSPKILEAEDGDLVLFRGRDTLHRVSPVEEELSRVLVTLNFNTEPGISLSELARQTFFGRLQ